MADLNKLLMKNKQQTVIVVMIIISVMISKDIYGRQVTKSSALAEQIRTEREKAAALDRIVVLNEDLKKIKVRSWDTTDSNRVVNRIFNLGLDAKIKITDITPGDKRDEKNYIVLPLSLTCDTTYSGLLRFVKKLELYPMLTRIREVSVHPSGILEKEIMSRNPTLRVNLIVETVYFK